MTPREFIRQYRSSDLSLRAGADVLQPLDVNRGETVGVVMLYDGGPERLQDVQPFLYNRFMDPVRETTWWGASVHHQIASMRARMNEARVRGQYEKIGGSPVNRLVREQAQALKQHLNERYGDPNGVHFRTYRAMRYWHPLSEEIAAEMDDYGFDRVVLLPLFPQFSPTTTGSSVAYWQALRERDDVPDWPTTLISAYAANPKYVQAVSERIDEGLQRFPRSVRSDVHLLFCGTDAARTERSESQDPYCRQVRTTVSAIMERRDGDRSYGVCYPSSGISSTGPTSSTQAAFADLSPSRPKHVLVVPISRGTDHLSTVYALDIEAREAADAAGIHHYEVASALNAHPLYIEALGEAVGAQLRFPSRSGSTTTGAGTMGASESQEETSSRTQGQATSAPASKDAHPAEA